MGEKMTSGNEDCYWCDGKNMYLMRVGLDRVVLHAASPNHDLTLTISMVRRPLPPTEHVWHDGDV